MGWIGWELRLERLEQGLAEITQLVQEAGR